MTLISYLYSLPHVNLQHIHYFDTKYFSEEDSPYFYNTNIVPPAFYSPHPDCQY
jgi:hypothetical protein